MDSINAHYNSRKMKLKQLITESVYTENAQFCKKFVLAQPQFSANKWSAIGGYNYRTQRGSNVMSQHAYGNAWDWHGSPATMKALTKFFIKHGARLNIENIIYNRKIYSASSYTELDYHGEDPHTNHVHVDFKVGTKPIYDVNINKRLEKIFNHFYYMLVTNPSKYFSKYKSVLDDDETGAVNMLIDEYNSYVYRLKFWNRVVDEKNKTNIKTLTKLITSIIEDIKKGESSKYRIIFYKNNGSNYQNKEYIFTWNYM